MFIACHDKASMSSPTRTPRTVRTDTARAVKRTLDDEVIGTLRARTSATIAASVTGRIGKLNVTVGSRVRTGQVLLTLSASEIDAKAEHASAALAQASIELHRAEQLRSSQAIPASAYDAAVAQHRMAQAQLAEANAMRAYTSLRAPFDGVITGKECDVGDLAVMGKTLLVLESPGALRLEAAVPEAMASLVHMGDVLTAHIDAIATPLAATVSELGAAADPRSRTVLIKLDIPDLPNLRAGMFGRLAVPTGEERVIIVPTAAIVRRGQMETVFVVEGDSARLRLVRTGRTEGQTTEVRGGLDDGERIVIDDVTALTDGQTVEVES